MMLGEALQRWAACLDMSSTKVCTLASGDGWLVLGLLCLVFVAAGLGRKLITTLLTLRAMALAPALSRRLSKWVHSYDYADAEFLRADGAGEPWIELRQKALDRLAMFFQAHYAKSMTSMGIGAWTWVALTASMWWDLSAIRSGCTRAGSGSRTLGRCWALSTPWSPTTLPCSEPCRTWMKCPFI